MKINTVNSANNFGGRLFVYNNDSAYDLDRKFVLIAETPQAFETLKSALKRIDDEAKKHNGKLPYFYTENVNLQVRWAGSFRDEIVLEVEGRGRGICTKYIKVDATEEEKMRFIKEFADTLCYKISGKQEEDVQGLLDLYA